MKSRYHIVLLTLLGAIGSLSCNKQTVVDNAKQVGISSVVYFPSVTIKGAKIVAFTAGGNFTDPGVTALLNGSPTPVTTTPAITSSTPPGVYTVTYTATNPQGYTASDWRFVVVVPASVAADATVQANDFSGTYLRAATGVTSTWTKIAAGVYQVENAGGATSGVGLLSVLTNYSGTTVSIPSQNDPYYGGTISTSNAVYTVGSPSSYHWVLNAPNYGTGVRTFVMQ